MKKIEAVIRQEKLENLKKAIDCKYGISGMTTVQVLGCGNQKGVKEFVRGQAVITTLLPKVKISLVVSDSHTEEVISKILEICSTDEVGDGKIFVSNVEEVIRIRTKERGEEAI